MSDCLAVDLVVTPEGRLDAVTAPLLEQRLRSLPDAVGKVIVVDLSRLTYVSSSGLRVLLLAHRRQRQAGGMLLLRNPTPRVWQVIRLSGFDQILDACEETAPDPPS